MKEHLIIFLVLVISISGISQTFAQEKQKIPTDFFMGKWGGRISGVVVDKSHRDVVKKYPFHVELIGHPAKLAIGPVGGGATAWMKLEATWPNKFTFVDTDAAVCVFYGPEPILTITYSVSDPGPITDLGYLTIFHSAGFTVKVENKNLLHLTSVGADEDLWEDSYATGELYRVYTKKDTFGKTVKVNEPIKTDKFTQREIIVPKVGNVIVNTNSEGKFKSESWFEQALGEIHSKIKPGGNYKVQMPQTVCGVRGTQFITKVGKDGTTTLTVLDGEVEFSDIQKRKTVIVKKNQRSVVKPDGLPSEPVSIDPNQIPRWWE